MRWLLAVLVQLGRLQAGDGPVPQTRRPSTPPTRVPQRRGGSPIRRLHARRATDEMVTDAGLVVKLLPDDNEGSRHQRLLVDVDNAGLTIKLSHNIDLAPRVPAREGDRVTFRGEYAWNALGGAVHWTHHDPRGWREGGWVELRGRRYE